MRSLSYDIGNAVWLGKAETSGQIYLVKDDLALQDLAGW